MNAGIEPGGNQALVERAKSIILKPRDEWPKIEAETTSQGDILRSYVLPLAAIGPVASLIGGQVFGYGALGFSYRPTLFSSLTQAIISYAMTIVGVFVLGFIADFLAPKFAGQSNGLNAFKLVAYGATAAWLAGIFGLIPSLGFFGLLGLYSFYLFYTGATPLMKVPEDKAVGYTAVTFLCALVIMIVVQFVAGKFVSQPSADIMKDNSEVSGTITLPGGGKIDLGDAKKVQKQVEDAVSGKTKPLDLGQLKELLPESVGPYERIAVQSTSAGAIGSSGEGTYRSGDKQFTLTITDMAVAGAVANLAGAFGVAQEKEDADSYERTGKVDGQMQTEAWNRKTNSGKFGKVVADRFMVEADGSAGSIDELKAAVNAVDEGDLKDLAE